ncbi:hypothetical protein [Parabacteroides sp. PF5-9]|uniref:hypothetical protein n=1 Tax=Parabacteroides sp. PF5-9 TaxID=1742404 RepID=UPI0024763830|nr:hypothetical protein [Parabacteroides sp. PF5-9]MDH6356314.1 hypothetical protein [Parabacteroides sp. PF5-9]
MNEKQIDELIDKVLKEEQSLPSGIDERLERYVDALIEKDSHNAKTISLTRKRSLYWISGIAAAIILGVALFFQTETTVPQPMTADTFTDPEEAAVAAHKALAFMSTQLNKGFDEVSEAGKEFEKVNDIINKPFK